MSGHNTSFLPRPTVSSVVTRPAARSSISPSVGDRHYDAGESSNAASFRYDASVDGSSLDRSPPRSRLDSSPGSQPPQHGKQASSHDVPRRRLPHKSRPSSSFLLPSTTPNNSSTSSPRYRDDRRASRIPVDTGRGKRYSGSSDVTDLQRSSSAAAEEHEVKEKGKMRSTETPSNTMTETYGNKSHNQVASRRLSGIPSLRSSSAPLDVDSTQIVSMALDLSESRRLGGGSLKQHLHQQRRSSRNISPRADRGLAPRLVSTPRISSPLQPSFDHETSYTYHFSISTLTRAQKAKEYLELMAQYRRLLLFLPPLKQEARSRPSTSSHTNTSNSASLPLDLASSQTRALGRPYNPLQYIRNRKVRTRERKVVDGEAQGFGDVPRVTDWIDEVATLTAASLKVEAPKLPPFPAADEWSEQQLPASNLPRPVTASNKPKRQRFEWSIDPADMIADVYWLEQGDNRYLIEDRHFAKIFPPKPASHQQISRSDETGKQWVATPSTKGRSNTSNGHSFPDYEATPPPKTDSGVVTSTRDRARQKLQDWRGVHHRHSNSAYSHTDFRRLRRTSSPDTSDSENDHRRRGRGNTIRASENGLFEKQINQIIAREAEEAEEERAKLAAKSANPNNLKPLPAGMSTPERESEMRDPVQVRSGSRVQVEGQQDKAAPDKLNQISPLNSGRTSLEVPSLSYRSSVDLDFSGAANLDTRAREQKDGILPASGFGFSTATSRPSSPARHPLSKVRNIFRERSGDRSRDRSRGREDHANDEKNMSPLDPSGALSIAAVTNDLALPPERSRSNSSTREFTLKPTYESHKSHRSLSSLSLRPDEQAGLRAILKGGAKLDDMIRGGVTRVTDLIWKKDADAASVASDDGSEMGDTGGQAREPALLSPDSTSRRLGGQRTVKNYLDVMPDFKPAAELSDMGSESETATATSQIISRRPSRSPRFEQLKPPRIDIRRASPALSELGEEDTQDLPESSRSGSDIASRPSQTSKELQNALSIGTSASPVADTQGNGHAASDHQHWAIPRRTSLSHTAITRREVARLRTLILCSGIKALEISRRANEPQAFFASGATTKAIGLLRTDINRFASGDVDLLSVRQRELFPTAGRILSQHIDQSLKTLEKSAFEFSRQTAPALQQRVDVVHDRIALEFMDMTRRAVDEADEVSFDMVDSQRLKVKSVVDTMDKMLRRRRRRFRWVRRAGWLAVEWVLVGFMWYVWFVVMIARVVLLTGRGIVSVVRWLLWL
ncbi:hypothetical protein F5Y17DRAFT_415603 [Xylariaceae sp. FL0594]|nr:hypothetical protein F5Y17DRAFT_415603 [Xylariaceae sp. FL0594]